jgi:hypothetical protein
MSDPAPPRRRGPGKWIAVGCGCMTLLGVVSVGVAVFAFKKVAANIEEIGQTGAAYLSARPEAAEAFGPLEKVERDKLKFNVQVRNDEGHAWFVYAVAGEKASGEAEVWLVRRGGAWQGVGARLHAGGKVVPVGRPGESGVKSGE